MKHPPDDLLLAYVRGQQRYLWPQDVAEHIAQCLVCGARCAELRGVGVTLETWAQSYSQEPIYSTVSQRVLRELYRPKPTLGLLPSLSQIRVRISHVALFGILCVVLLTGLTTYFAAGIARSKTPLARPTHVVYVPTRILQQPTPTPTLVVGINSGVTATPKGTPIITTACTTGADVSGHHLLVCGDNFTPGSWVTLYYKLVGHHSTLKHTVQVSGAGTFIDIWQMNACRDIPIDIYAESTTSPPELAQILKNITFGNCKTSGKTK